MERRTTSLISDVATVPCCLVRGGVERRDKYERALIITSGPRDACDNQTSRRSRRYIEALPSNYYSYTQLTPSVRVGRMVGIQHMLYRTVYGRYETSYNPK